MRTEVLSQEKNVISVKAIFEAEEVDREINATVKELTRKANIKGFRKGRVPRKTLELYYGKKAILDEALEKILSKALEEIIAEYELVLIDNPEVNPDELEEGSSFAFEATFEVTPEVTLPELDKIKAEKVIFEANDEMLEENIKRILEARAELVPSYEERPVKEDDYVSIKYTGLTVGEDGETTVAEKDAKTELNLAQPGLRPEMKEAIVGKNPSEKVSVELDIEMPDPEKDGTPVRMRYDIEILGIMKREVPELTDETVEQITQSRHKTVDEFKKTLMERLKTSAEEESLNSLRDSAVKELCDLSEVEVPETLIERQKNALRENQRARIERESGMKMEEFFEKSGVNKEDFEKELETAAAAIVKRSLVLDALAEREGIEALPSEFDAEINHMAVASQVDPEEFRKYIYADRDRAFEVISGVRSRKTIDFLIENVETTEISADEKSAQLEKEQSLKVEDQKDEENAE